MSSGIFVRLVHTRPPCLIGNTSIYISVNVAYLRRNTGQCTEFYTPINALLYTIKY